MRQDLQDKSGIWGDEAGEATRAVGVITIMSCQSCLDFWPALGCESYPVMVRVDFSPRDMPPSAERIPSSQPVGTFVRWMAMMTNWEGWSIDLTLDDLTSADSDGEGTVTAADG